jgi:nucleoside-diphosphate-sugar epimerase
VDDGRIYTWQELSSGIQKAIGKSAIPVFVPQTLISAAAYAGDAWAAFSRKPALLNRQKIIELKQRSWATSSEKIRNELGFVPAYDLGKGCTETVQWYREHGWLK